MARRITPKNPTLYAKTDVKRVNYTRRHHQNSAVSTYVPWKHDSAVVHEAGGDEGVVEHLLRDHLRQHGVRTLDAVKLGHERVPTTPMEAARRKTAASKQVGKRGE